jgi:hypothetical protein
VTDYTDEEYRAWVMELFEFLRCWPYESPEGGIIVADPPASPTRKGERVWSEWPKKLH